MTTDFSFPDINFEVFKKNKKLLLLVRTRFWFQRNEPLRIRHCAVAKKKSNPKNRSLLRLLI